ncbi:hypothetical protein PENTCL1PPCAC_7549 [Pristionchus entomophagus]|uniref:glucuronosyltransferase n=1 Tax=Pristionchus entomophagus TaxID=358040 RepID=A0AAV5SYM5_9BILA|nr:hypothetical protein PENTCL1PPCAC_7549 [Pristionchus entomophagus]
MYLHDIDFFGHDDFNLMLSIVIGRIWGNLERVQCKGVIDEPGLMERMREEKYDVMIVEQFDPCGAALSHLIQPKWLITTSGSVPFGSMVEEFGLDSAFSYNPSMMMSKFIPSGVASRISIHNSWSM